MLAEEDIHFSVEDVTQPDLPWDRVGSWLRQVITAEGKSLQSIRIRFCSDDHLLQLNRQYLDHDYYTDILTFPMSYDPIDTDIIISVERVIDHAEKYNVTTAHELSRVMVHGVLHMCGYQDHTEEEQRVMRSKEQDYLAIWQQ